MTTTCTTKPKSALRVKSKSILCSTTLETAQLKHCEFPVEGEGEDEDEDEDEDEGSENGNFDRNSRVRFRSERGNTVIPAAVLSNIPEDAWHNVAYYIRYWNLDFVQGKAFTDLRDRLNDVHHEYNRPGVCVRYLRTKHFNVKKAEKMFRDSLIWRADHQVDKLMLEYEPPTEILEKYPGAILKGCDKDGDPVFLSRMGVTDVPGLLQKYGHDGMIRYEIYKRESAMQGSWLPEWEQKSHRPIRHILIIEDLHGLGRKLLSSKIAGLYGDAMDVDQNHYPDSAKKIIIIRTPLIFRAVWTVVKRFFPDFIQRKMEFTGCNNYLEVLEKYMDLDILPPCINPDGHGEAAPGMPPSFAGGEIVI